MDYSPLRDFVSRDWIASERYDPFTDTVLILLSNGDKRKARLFTSDPNGALVDRIVQRGGCRLATPQEVQSFGRNFPKVQQFYPIITQTSAGGGGCEVFYIDRGGWGKDRYKYLEYRSTRRGDLPKQWQRTWTTGVFFLGIMQE